MSQLDDDIDAMIAAFDPVTVVFGQYTTNAIRDVWDQEVLRGTESGVIVGFLALQIRTNALPGLEVGSDVIVNGEPYTVRDRQRPIDAADGALTHLLLKKA